MSQYVEADGMSELEERSHDSRRGVRARDVGYGGGHRERNQR